MVRQRGHLSVVRSHEEEHAAKTQALQQIGNRVPSTMERVYDWDSLAAATLFSAMNTCVAEGMLVNDVEDALDMPGLSAAYMQWLGRQT
jgi:hypothetical protein